MNTFALIKPVAHRIHREFVEFVTADVQLADAQRHCIVFGESFEQCGNRFRSQIAIFKVKNFNAMLLRDQRHGDRNKSSIDAVIRQI